MTYLEPLPDPDEVALRSAVILGASAAIVVGDRAVLGTYGIDGEALAQVEEWIRTDQLAATPVTGRLRRVARAPWPGLSGTEVWVLGTQIRKLPVDAYTVLVAFLEQLGARAA
jgi:hypothetical protein